ncbi:hypothetical protein CRG98_032787 [Punica granatum]|uniref:Uncharacterized protein n=1 Tax=Punica granatum TaxID=22663 RepID=A0A2I0IS82_PUNGR|nr:hypothetical protein CRG98_032787 [Punica granatum]
MRNSSVTEPPESYLMNAGDGSYSYNKNSYFQRAATSTAKEKIDEAIATVLDIKRVPKELLDEGSPAWNKGKIHYTSTPKEVGDAYKSQFTKDMRDFFNARVQEIVSGGIMAFIVPGTQDGVPHSQVPLGVNLDILGLSLMDMAKEGIIKESDVDSLNLPIYTATPQEMTELVNTNGCFDIERMELTASRKSPDGSNGASRK